MSCLHIYSRPGCHLCEVLIEELIPMVRGVLELEVHDIDSRPEWRDRYDIRIPVVEFDDRVICQYQIDRAAIATLLEQVSGNSG